MGSPALPQGKQLVVPKYLVGVGRVLEVGEGEGAAEEPVGGDSTEDAPL